MMLINIKDKSGGSSLRWNRISLQSTFQEPIHEGQKMSK